MRNKILVALVIILLLSLKVLAAHDPGHDQLYIEEQGNSELNGSLNITDNVSIEDVLFTGVALNIRGDDIQTGTNNRIIGLDGNGLSIQSLGPIYINTMSGTTSTVYLGDGSDSVNLNITGALYVQSSTATIGGQPICLANGTNCPGGNNTGNVTSVTETGNTPLVITPTTGHVTISITIPTCSGTDKLTYNGTNFKCETDQDSGGTGDITAVYTNDKWLAGGETSGDVSLIFNESELNNTIDARDTDTTIGNCSGTGSCSNIAYLNTANTGYIKTSGDINTTSGDICIQGNKCLSQAGTGNGDITAVNTNGPYLYGGAASGDADLYINQTKLNTTIDARDDTDDTVSSSELDGICSTNNRILRRSGGTWACYDDSAYYDDTNTNCSISGGCGQLYIGTNILDDSSGSAAGADLYWGNDLVCDVSETACGWIDGITTTNGNGLDGGCTTGTCSLSVDVTDIIDTSYGLTENSNDIRIDIEPNHGLEFIGGDLAIINDCGDQEILKWNTTSNKWECKSDENSGGTGNMDSFYVDTDGEAATEITDGETVTFSDSTGMSVTRSGNTITFTNTGDTNAGDDLTTSTNWGGDLSGTGSNPTVNDDSHYHTKSTVTIAGENITSGTISTSRYSAYSDLSNEGYLNNDADTDLLTRTQADSRYINYGWDLLTDGTHRDDIGDNEDVGFDSGAGITITWDGSRDIIINHTDTSTQSSSDNSGNTFIQDITLDTFGHITSLATATVSESDPQVGTTTNTYVCYGTGSQVTCADSGITYATGTDSLTLGGDLTVSGGDITGAGNAALDIGEATASEFTFYDTTDTNEYVEFNCRDSDSTTLCQFNTGLYVSGGTFYANNQIRARGGIQDDNNGYLDLQDDVNITGDLKVEGGDITFGSTTISETDIDALDDGVIALGAETSGNYCSDSSCADSDSDATNEYPIAGNDIDVSTRTVSIESQLDYVNNIYSLQALRYETGDRYIIQLWNDADTGIRQDDTNNQIDYYLNGAEKGRFDLDNGNMQMDGDLTVSGGDITFGSTTISEADIDALDDGTITLGTETSGNYCSDNSCADSIASCTNVNSCTITAEDVVCNNCVGATDLADSFDNCNDCDGRFLFEDSSDVWNDDGGSDTLRFEGDNDQYLLYLVGSSDRVGIGTNNPGKKLSVNGDISVPSNNKICLDGATCSKYIYYDGSHVIIQG